MTEHNRIIEHFNARLLKNLLALVGFLLQMFYLFFLERMGNGNWTVQNNSWFLLFFRLIFFFNFGEMEITSCIISPLFPPPSIWLFFTVDCAISLVVPTTELEWVPLELCFGIPLFSSELNRKVCRKIATHGLCRKERWDFFSHSCCICNLICVLPI